VPLAQSTLLEWSLGGSEVNVAVALAARGHRVGWAGAVGDDPFGDAGLARLAGCGVDVSRAVVDPSAPTGVYFKEVLASGALRNYAYRAGSAASRMTTTDLDLDYLLSARLLHLTGITASLSASGLDLVGSLSAAARDRDVEVSFDVNLRHKLLRGRDPVALLRPLIRQVDLVLCSRQEAALLLGTDDPDQLAGLLSDLAAHTLVVHDEGGAFAVTREGTATVTARRAQVVDPTGAGDAFAAGFLSGRLDSLPVDACLDRGAELAALVVADSGDHVTPPVVGGRPPLHDQSGPAQLEVDDR
jgi:2-dehydro-3-deoxygluconokinase